MFFFLSKIHTDWREEIIDQSMHQTFSLSETDHANSDDCGVSILGPEMINSGMIIKGHQLIY